MSIGNTVLGESEVQGALLYAVLRALPILRSDRCTMVEGATVQGADGEPDMLTLEESAKPYIYEYDRAIAICEDALRKVGLW